MPRVVYEWEGIEYDHNPKSGDWYWAVGIVATAGALAAILFGNVLLAVLVVVAAAALALHAVKTPGIHRFALTEQGVMIGEELHPFDQIRSFSVFEYIEGDKPPVLSIKTESWLSPHLLIPLGGVDADGVYKYLLTHVHEAEHPHTINDVVAAWLGF